MGYNCSMIVKEVVSFLINFQNVISARDYDDELHRILNDRDMKEAVVLLFANKQDLRDAIKLIHLTVNFRFEQITRQKLVFAAILCDFWGRP